MSIHSFHTEEKLTKKNKFKSSSGIFRIRHGSSLFSLFKIFDCLGSSTFVNTISAATSHHVMLKTCLALLNSFRFHRRSSFDDQMVVGVNVREQMTQEAGEWRERGA